jgi:membrane protein DedA with SNARE-associated domain
MAEFWAEWGALAYLAAAVWAFFEGETFVLLAAAAGRATRVIDPWILMLCVWGGSFMGDQLWFTLGQRYGRRAVAKIPGAERRMDTALRFLDRYGVAFVLCFRFLYGIRNVAAAACGMAGMNRMRFAALNFIAAGVWAGSFVAAGWFAVGWLGEENTLYAFCAFGMAVVFCLVVKMLLSRRRASLATTQARQGGLA